MSKYMSQGNQLNEIEKKFLKSLSLVLILDPIVWLSYGLLRKQYYFLIIFLFPVLYQIFRMTNFLNAPVVLRYSLLVLMEALIIYSTIKARKLSWIRCEWRDFKLFQNSEKKWQILALVFFVLSFIPSALPFDFFSFIETIFALRF
jgi:hypothetical protein